MKMTLFFVAISILIVQPLLVTDFMASIIMSGIRKQFSDKHHQLYNNAFVLLKVCDGIDNELLAPDKKYKPSGGNDFEPVGFKKDSQFPEIILNQNFSNPFFENTNISRQLPFDTYFVLNVFDFIGCEVKMLFGQAGKGQCH
ncbi:MAG: hypothetical protein Q7U54_05945 [Bacteroidales bacterium]|nr:hypothetical protein [Bacteroidales bacterium]